jgi:hypothetical protein
MPAKKPVSDGPDPFRLQITVSDASTGISEEAVRKLAVRQSRPHLAEIDHTKTIGRAERTAVQREIASLMVEVARAAADGAHRNRARERCPTGRS